MRRTIGTKLQRVKPIAFNLKTYCYEHVSLGYMYVKQVQRIKRIMPEEVQP